MPTGLRMRFRLQRIVDAMNAVEANWRALSPDQRCRQIGETVIEQLRDVRVMVPTLQLANLGAGLNGQFDFTPWTVQVNTGMAIGRVSDTPQQLKTRIAALGDIITHESRHCEQWWRMIRLVVGDMRDRGVLPTAAVLAGTFPGVSMAALSQAIGAPALNRQDIEETRPWFESAYGRGVQFRDINLFGRQLRPTPGRFAQVGAQFRQGEFARYQRGLAEEEDAHQAGHEIQAMYLEGSGVAPAPLTGHRPIAQGIAQF